MVLPSECIEMPHRRLPSSLCDEEISCFRTDTDGGLDEHPVHHVLWGCRPPGLRSLLQCSDVLEVPCSTLCGCKPLCGLGVVLSAVRGFHSCWWARLRTLFYHSKMQYKKARAEVPPRKFKKCRRFYPKIGLANYIAVHVRLVGHRRHGLRTPNIFG